LVLTRVSGPAVTVVAISFVLSVSVSATDKKARASS
jgi:hypothetical protein